MKNLNRREWLKRSTVLVASAAIAPLVFVNKASASDLQSKSEVGYQDHPDGNKQCSNCSHFVPGSSPTAAGTCKVVAGSISPNGYCYAYAPA